jgi:hypothetical protein
MRSPGLQAIGYHSVEAIPSGSRATLSVTYDGLLGGLVTKLLAKTTQRFLGLEANGLRKRSEAVR